MSASATSHIQDRLMVGQATPFDDLRYLDILVTGPLVPGIYLHSGIRSFCDLITGLYHFFDFMLREFNLLLVLKCKMEPLPPFREVPKNPRRCFLRVLQHFGQLRMIQEELRIDDRSLGRYPHGSVFLDVGRSLLTNRLDLVNVPADSLGVATPSSRLFQCPNGIRIRGEETPGEVIRHSPN